MNELLEKQENSLSSMIISMFLGALFLIALLGYIPIVAKDGRVPITDWLDPMLAGVTLLCILLIQLLLVVSWKRIGSVKVKKYMVWGLLFSQWSYIFGEILSNTITIGEPPNDIGSIFEMIGGGVAFVIMIGLTILIVRIHVKSIKKPVIFLITLSILLMIGMIWWFTHPIDQAKSGTPQCVSGNPIYNFFHGPC